MWFMLQNCKENKLFSLLITFDRDLSRNQIVHIDAGAFLHVRNLQDL